MSEEVVWNMSEEVSSMWMGFYMGLMFILGLLIIKFGRLVL